MVSLPEVIISRCLYCYHRVFHRKLQLEMRHYFNLCVYKCRMDILGFFSISPPFMKVRLYLIKQTRNKYLACSFHCLNHARLYVLLCLLQHKHNQCRTVIKCIYSGRYRWLHSLSRTILISN